VASIAGILAAPGLSAYSASKYALEAFSDSLRREVSAPWRLRVCLIEPSFLQTPILAGVEEKAAAQWAALSPPTRARWGETYFHGTLRHSKGIVRRAEPPSLAVAELLAAVRDFEPAERYRAGTAGKYLLPIIAALPAWAADALVAGYGVSARPAGLDIPGGAPLEADVAGGGGGGGGSGGGDGGGDDGSVHAAELEKLAAQLRQQLGGAELLAQLRGADVAAPRQRPQKPAAAKPPAPPAEVGEE
jgi:hypothetical protein